MFLVSNNLKGVLKRYQLGPYYTKDNLLLSADALYFSSDPLDLLKFGLNALLASGHHFHIHYHHRQQIHCPDDQIEGLASLKYNNGHEGP